MYMEVGWLFLFYLIYLLFILYFRVPKQDLAASRTSVWALILTLYKLRGNIETFHCFLYQFTRLVISLQC